MYPPYQTINLSGPYSSLPPVAEISRSYEGKGRFFMSLSRSAKCDEGEEYVKAEQTDLRSPCKFIRRSTARPPMEIPQVQHQATLDNATQRVCGQARHHNQSLPLSGKRYDVPTNFLDGNKRAEGDRLAGGSISRWIPQASQRVSSYWPSWVLYQEGNESVLRGTMYKGVRIFILNKHESQRFSL